MNPYKTSEQIKKGQIVQLVNGKWKRVPHVPEQTENFILGIAMKDVKKDEILPVTIQGMFVMPKPKFMKIRQWWAHIRGKTHWTDWYYWGDN